MMRVPVREQKKAILGWLVKFGGRRPSEAAMETVAMSPAGRRRLFARLQRLGCVVKGDAGEWRAERDVPAHSVKVPPDDSGAALTALLALTSDVRYSAVPWGDRVVDGKLTITVDAGAVEAALAVLDRARVTR